MKEVDPVRPWRQALRNALICEGRVNVLDLAERITPGPAERAHIEALSEAARSLILDGRAALDPEALEQGVAILVAVR